MWVFFGLHENSRIYNCTVVVKGTAAPVLCGSFLVFMKTQEFIIVVVKGTAAPVLCGSFLAFMKRSGMKEVPVPPLSLLLFKYLSCSFDFTQLLLFKKNFYSETSRRYQHIYKFGNGSPIAYNSIIGGTHANLDR